MLQNSCLRVLHIGLLMTAGVPASARAGFRSFQAGEIKLGQTVPGSYGLSQPGGVVVDPVSKKVFVCDTNCNRVLRYASAAWLTAGSAAEAVLGNSGFDSIAKHLSAGGMFRPCDAVMDTAGHLWVTDQFNSRVLPFDNAANIPSCSLALGRAGAA